MEMQPQSTEMTCYCIECTLHMHRFSLKFIRSSSAIVVTWWSGANRFSMQKTFRTEIMCVGHTAVSHLSSKPREHEHANSENSKCFHSNTDNTMKMICHLHVHDMCVFWTISVPQDVSSLSLLSFSISSFTIRVSVSTLSLHLALAFSFTHLLNHPFTHSLSMCLCFGIFFAEAMCV